MNRPALLCASLSILLLSASGQALFAADPLPPVQVDAGADPEGVYVAKKRQRTEEEVAKLQAEAQPVAYEPPADRFAKLPRTKKLLDDGGELTIVMLGDSIVNDTARSDWTFDLAKLYSEATIEKYTVVRGSTGCWWYREPGRVERYVLAFEPDLVMIGGISQRNDVDAIADVIDQIRAKSPDTEFLLMTGPFGQVDPTDDEQWKMLSERSGEDYGAKLAALAEAKGAAFLDVQRLWAETIRASGKPLAEFKRDAVHANGVGEQILGQILLRHFAPEK